MSCHKLSNLSVCLLMLGSVLLVTGLVQAEVTIDEDEVIFTLHHPGAGTVFLVGDFNNWNPTVEKMVKEGDRFVVSLFLIEGDYRYKFVVDGKWIHDPDNPPQDPSLGSPLFLAEQDEILVFKVVGADGTPADVNLETAVRYIGDFRWAEDSKALAGQVVDVDISVEARSYSSSLTIKTTDDSWTASPLEASLEFYAGRLDLQVKRAWFSAFKCDTSWVSADPFNVFGYKGVYDVEFGYDEKGVSVELPVSKSFQLSAVYADRIGRETAPGAADLPAADLAGLAEVDTALYAWSPGFGDLDVFGFETRLAVGKYHGGYVLRINRGAHPGLENRIAKMDSMVTTTAYRTFENWYAHVLWGSAELFGRIRATTGVGWADTRLQRTRRTVITDSVLQAVDIGQDAPPWNSNTQIQNSRRVMGSLSYETRRFKGEIQAGHHTARFEPGLFKKAKAERFRAGVTCQVRRPGWTGAFSFGYTDQEYGDSPAAFHFDSAERNYWLDGSDPLRPEGLAVLSNETSSIARGVLALNPSPFLSGGPFNYFGVWPSGPAGTEDLENPTDRPHRSMVAEFGVAADGLAESFEFGYLRLFIDQPLVRRYYLQADTRGVIYDKSLWAGRREFISWYLEAGYRTGRLELSAGFGFDPVILDPIRNEYYDIGRTERLRESLADGISRDGTASIGRRLLDLERQLEVDRTLKLECILSF